MSLVICGGCGKEISSEYKFCPYCGAELAGGVKANELPAEIVSTEVIVCSNCGDESPAGNKSCVNCGALLSGEKVVKNVAPAEKPVVAVKPRVENKSAAKTIPAQKVKKQKAKTNIKQEKSTKDIFRDKVTWFSGGVIVVAIAAVLYFSGVFDSAKSEDELSVPEMPQQPGVDLNSVQRINELEAAVEANPGDMEKTLQLGHLLMDSRLFERAVIYYKKYLTADPRKADVLVDMGVCFFELRDYASADSVMREAVKINPRHQIAHMNLGVVNMNWGKMEQAREWLRKAVDIDPSSEHGIRAKSLLESH